jgi:hypothetical protein
MAKGIERQIVLKRMKRPINKQRLKPNEYKVAEYWKAVYEGGMLVTAHERGELNEYVRSIDGINSTRGEEPAEIDIKFKKL